MRKVAAHLGVVLIVHVLDFLDGARRIVEIMVEQRPENSRM